MLRTTALLLSLTGALNSTPAQIDAIPTEIVQSVEAVQEEIIVVTTPAPEPEPEPIPPAEEKPPVEVKPPESQPFATVLGTYTTSYNPNQANRCNNIRLAAQAISGKVLQPGESFSFNTVVGRRTAARGYKTAGIFSGGQVAEGIGGGICQVSSTLFNAALLSNMQITSRTCHGLPVGYLPPGRDATVSWGGPEFIFKNSNTYPVKVTAGYDSVKGTVTVSVLGPENASVPDIKIKVEKDGKKYITKRTMNGVVNYTTSSFYK